MTTVNISEAKNRLSELVKEAEEATVPIKITVHGRGGAILISEEEYESLRETIEIMKNRKLVEQINQSLKEFAEGKTVPFEKIRRAV